MEAWILFGPKAPHNEARGPAWLFTHGYTVPRLPFEVPRLLLVIWAQPAAERSTHLAMPTQRSPRQSVVRDLAEVGCHNATALSFSAGYYAFPVLWRKPRNTCNLFLDIASSASTNGPIHVRRFTLAKAVTLELSQSVKAPFLRACLCTPGLGSDSRDLHPWKFNLRVTPSV